MHVVTQLNPDAISIAASLDAERANGTVRGPLHGIPILIKNNIATNDSMDNTAGSYSLAGAKVPRDSTMAAKLRKAGAVILGKTNLSQWANFRSYNTSNGWSALGGQVKGAYLPGQDPSGSSSGSGVSSSLGLALACLGTETDGSVIDPSEGKPSTSLRELCKAKDSTDFPSSVNNLVGIKPTSGLTSRDLVIPISEHQDTVGTMARTVRDAAYLLTAIAGYSPYDNYTSAIPYLNYTTPDYTTALNFSALRGARIGIPRNAFDTASNRASAYAPTINTFNNYALPILRQAGAIIVDNITWPGVQLEPVNASTFVLEEDLVTDLAKYLSELTYNPQNVNSLADVRNYTHSDPREDWPARDTGLWDDALGLYGGQGNTSPDFWSNYTLLQYIAGPQAITGSLKNYSLDALIMPTTFASHYPALLGSPVVTVPMGAYPANSSFTLNSYGDLNATGPNLPIGLSFMAERFSEQKLIGLAYAFEQRTNIRQQVQPLPSNIPTTEIADVLGKGSAMKMRRKIAKL